ncbi:MAG: Fe-S cluster assembly ATPase SufC [Legionellales bacterium]|nr:Fe-S cluster assembly ATPase SufC [Legionellales bacterium]
MLEINNLHVEVQNQKILQGIDLCINPGEVHAIMGPNGAGKSTLTNILAGKEGYIITKGTIKYYGKDLLELTIEERAHLGIFIAFQYPVVLPGVSNINFLKSAVNANRKARDQQNLDAIDFLNLVKDKLATIKMDEEFLYRSVNDGFSGGEKKRNEVLQMSLLEPNLCILDETDSGLDIDALKIVANGVNELRSSKRSFLVITHYQRLLDYIVPDFVHVLQNGTIVKSGDQQLALELEEKGYQWLQQ